MFQVKCADGQIRHAQPFATRHDAWSWAEWGHCCLTDHTIVPTREPAPAHIQPPTVDATLALVRALADGKLLIAFTPAQLQVALEAVGSHAGRLADDTAAPSDAYVPFAALQSYLARFQQEV